MLIDEIYNSSSPDVKTAFSIPGAALDTVKGASVSRRARHDLRLSAADVGRRDQHPPFRTLIGLASLAPGLAFALAFGGDSDLVADLRGSPGSRAMRSRSGKGKRNFAIQLGRCLTSNAARPLIVAFDNVDRRESAQQLHIFQAAQWFRRETHAFTTPDVA
jgi:hypothetical protein